MDGDGVPQRDVAHAHRARENFLDDLGVRLEAQVPEAQGLSLAFQLR
jgi:hypothetical protein